MATHFYDDCPAMNDGDAVLDKEGLDLEDWMYDCRTCQYVEHVEETAWTGFAQIMFSIPISCASLVFVQIRGRFWPAYPGWWSAGTGRLFLDRHVSCLGICGGVANRWGFQICGG